MTKIKFQYLYDVSWCSPILKKAPKIVFAPNSDCPQNSVFGAIYELNIWGYNSLRVSTLLSVMKIKINGVITFRPARSKVGIHITYMTRLTPRAQSQRKLLTVDLYSLEIKKWENKTRFSMNSDFLVLTRKNKENSF